VQCAQYNLLLKFSAASSVKDSIKSSVMSRLFSNEAMSFLSLSGRNLGKMALAETRIYELILGMILPSLFF
jgi:hypothetical protein